MAELEEIIDGEINHAIAMVQKGIDQTDGGLAGEHFSGNDWDVTRRNLISHFAHWLDLEFKLVTEPKFQESFLNSRDIESALQRSHAWEVEVLLERAKSQALKDRESPYPDMEVVKRDLQEILKRYHSFWCVTKLSPYYVWVTHDSDKFTLSLADSWVSTTLVWDPRDNQWLLGEPDDECVAYGWNITNWQGVGRGDPRDM